MQFVELLEKDKKGRVSLENALAQVRELAQGKPILVYTLQSVGYGGDTTYLPFWWAAAEHVRATLDAEGVIVSTGTRWQSLDSIPEELTERALGVRRVLYDEFRKTTGAKTRDAHSDDFVRPGLFERLTGVVEQRRRNGDPEEHADVFGVPIRKVGKLRQDIARASDNGRLNPRYSIYELAASAEAIVRAQEQEIFSVKVSLANQAVDYAAVRRLGLGAVVRFDLPMQPGGPSTPYSVPSIGNPKSESYLRLGDSSEALLAKLDERTLESLEYWAAPYLSLVRESHSGRDELANFAAQLGARLVARADAIGGYPADFVPALSLGVER